MNMCKPGGLSCCLCLALAPWQLTHCFWCFSSYFRFNTQVTLGALGQFFRQLSKWSIQQLLSNHLFSEFVWKCRTDLKTDQYHTVSLPNFKIHTDIKRIQQIVSGCSRLGFRSKSAKSHVQFQRLHWPPSPATGGLHATENSPMFGSVLYVYNG